MANKNNNSNYRDIKYIKLAYEQAMINLGSTSLNPSVGCVIVKKNSVISLGGGAFLNKSIRTSAKKTSITFWLDVHIDELVKRLVPEKAHRPLIKNLSDAALHDFLTNKRNERLPFYEQATIHLTKADINEKTFLKIIKENAK